MPENANADRRKHPAAVLKFRGLDLGNVARDGGDDEAVAFAEVCCRSNFSFLRGASHPEELVDRAAELEYRALGVCDRSTLAGVVRMHVAARQRGLRLIVGAEIVPVDAPPIALYAMDRAGYGRLATLISRGKLRAVKGECEIRLADIAELSAGLVAVVLDTGARAETGEKPVPHLRGKGFPLGWVRERILAPAFAGATPGVFRYREVFGDRLYLAGRAVYGGDDAWHLAERAALSRRCGVPLIATNDVHYHDPQRRFLQDVLTCVREHCTLEQAGRRLFANAERHLKSPGQMAGLFADYPDAIRRTVELAERCHFNLDELRYEYPEELCPEGLDLHAYLTQLTFEGARQRYPGGVPEKVRRLVEHELTLIRELKYEPYFLTVWDIVKYAWSRKILCQGRGSAANSAVCYCLGITSVDPDRIDVLFERFVSQERNEPPDIDVDFEHERREEVLQYIYDKYGRDRAGIVAEVITYRPRSAVRDVGKALGLSLDRVDRIAKSLEWWAGQSVPQEHLIDAGIDPADRTIRCLVKLAEQLMGFPRHLSQHVGGFVITRGKLSEMVPIGNAAMPDRTFIEWDKDDIDALGILKVDCLCLGMLTAIRKCLGMINQATKPLNHEATKGKRLGTEALRHEGTEGVLTLDNIPPEDPVVYDMICRADTVGVFQVESRAQMSMLPRLKPRCYYDLVIEVAIIRPGPIQGKMVHPYLRRRNGEEPVTYPTPQIEQALHKTLGIPLFQEQAMRLAVVAAGFTPGEADQLRRSMGVWRRNGVMDRFRDKLIEGMLRNGLDRDFAERTFEQICGFGGYGFPESHAASFALLVYVSCWLKRYYPAAYCAGVINSQPMGFYAPAQLVRDAVQHGVEVRGVDVGFSDYDCTLEEESGVRSQGSGVGSQGWGVGGPSLRLGMRLVKGLSEAKVEGIVRARAEGVFRSVADLFRRSGASRDTLARLAAADAFGSMGLNRREALWQVLSLDAEKAGVPTLFDDLDPPLDQSGSAWQPSGLTKEPPALLPRQSLSERVAQDYLTFGMSLVAHPMSLLRERLDKMKAATSDDLQRMRHGEPIRTAGMVLIRQRPATAKGTMFFTLEDEHGVINLIVRQAVYEKFRKARKAVVLWAEGQVQRQGEVIHVLVQRMANLTDKLTDVRVKSRDFR